MPSEFDNEPIKFGIRENRRYPPEPFNLTSVAGQNNAIRESSMRTFGFAIAVAAAMFVLPVNAQRFEIGPGGVRIGGSRLSFLVTRSRLPCGGKPFAIAVNLVSRIEAVAKTLNLQIVVSDDFARVYGKPLQSLEFHRLRGLSTQHELFAPQIAAASTC